MRNGPDKTSAAPRIASIDELLRSETGRQIEAGEGRSVALAIAREAAARIRQQVQSGKDHAPEGFPDAASEMQRILAERHLRMLNRVINATGVIIHTNLGRSRLSQAAAARAAEAAANYCNLEYDLGTGKRGRRGRGAEAALAELTAAEDALVVNNCAAAALLALSEFAAGREVIISRGELVEIGGDFRIPDVLAQSGAVLREVGTTNRTKLADYQRAINERTAAILRVHPSNFRIVGFSQTPEPQELAAIAAAAGVLFIEDAGSGALVDLSPYGLGDEPVIANSIAAGADLVLFSGDKLLGGPQAGIIAGRSAYVARLRRNPLLRALRPDKITYAGLEATLAAYQRGTHFDEIPTLRMLSVPPTELHRRAESLAGKLRPQLRAEIEVFQGESAVGGGAAPNAALATSIVAISPNELDVVALSERLRQGSPPVIARISGGRLLIDLRTVGPEEENALTEAILTAIG